VVVVELVVVVIEEWFVQLVLTIVLIVLLKII
jgi:hypothetical protein